VTATTQARPKLWPLGVVVGVCILVGIIFLLGGGTTKAHSATPVRNSRLALDTTVTVTETPPPSVTTVTSVSVSVSTFTFYLPPTTTYTQASATTNITNVHNQTNVIHRTQTQVNHVNSTAVFNVNQTNQVNATVLATRQITKGVNVTNSVIVTNTAQETATALQTVEITSTSKASKPLANRVRLAIGAGGVAVTSAAGFGFLMLRRRGRYTG
jgi:hypothetical protein